MKPMTIQPATDECVPHRVYDLSITDMNERREKSLPFRSGMAAANWLGITPKHMYKYRKPGVQLFSKKHNKKFAVRIDREMAKEAVA